MKKWIIVETECPRETKDRIIVETERQKRTFGNVLALPKGTGVQKAYAIARQDYLKWKMTMQEDGIELEDPTMHLQIGWKAREK